MVEARRRLWSGGSGFLVGGEEVWCRGLEVVQLKGGEGAW